MSQSSSFHLYLSDNQISELIPSWICNVGVLDLHSNQLRGEIPMPPVHEYYVDYSRKKGLRRAPFIACSKEAEPMSPTLDSRHSYSDEDGIN
ncbi:hypothetical protein Vadar_012197 [Vaccinium darrowii]|uniref:Uncharacterized protein n=1 Tax=Vaccinium darrowii TaxID=229202 RepID=A0ACB7ZIU5_9ERIC|nr:hypothetical protein Vadar_012197 [Vaccinium darrowii]